MGKILAAVLLTIIVMIVVATFGYSYIKRVGDLVQQTSGIELIAMEQIANVKAEGAMFQAASAQAVGAADAASAQSFITEADGHDQNLKDSLNEFKRIELDADDKQNLSQLATLWDSFSQQAKASMTLAVQGQQAQARAGLDASASKFKQFMDGVEKIIRDKNNDIEQLSGQSQQVVADSRQRFLIFVVVVGLLSLGLGILLARIISRPLKEMAKTAELISHGNLSTDIAVFNTGDELGSLSQAFKQMVDNLAEILGGITAGSKRIAGSSQQLNAGIDQITKSAEQIAVTIQQVAVGSDGQVRSVAEVTSAINQMSSGIQQIASNAQSVSASAIETSRYAHSGREAIDRAAQQMDSIRTTVDKSAEVIQLLGEKSEAIGNIVDLIRNIAEQTNLLALNAAIEAARAGEQGRGFAVVADEVRKLAEQSADATKEIADLIAAVKQETERAVKAMDLGTKEAAHGTVVVGKAGNAFADILNAVEGVSKQIQEVSLASQEMASGSSQVVKAVETIAHIAQETSSQTQNVAAAAEEQTASLEEIRYSANSLSKMSAELDGIVERFKFMDA